IADGDDAVAHAHRRQPVCDDDDGAAAHDLPHVVLDYQLALVIERAGRFVEYKDARLGRQSAGDGDALALAAGKVGAALLDHGVVAERQLGNELVGTGEPRHGDDLGAVHGGIGERDVVVDGAVEQQVLLQHDADLAAQPGGVDLPDIDPVDLDLPALRPVETLHQFRQRRLARAGGSDDTYHLPGRNLQVDAGENLRSAGHVTEADTAELDGAARGRQRDLAEALTFRRGIQDVAQPFDGDLRLLEVLPELRQAQDRRRHLVHDHVEGDQPADRHLAVDHSLGAEEQHQH